MGFDIWDIDTTEEKEVDINLYKNKVVKVKGTLARIMYPKPPSVHESGQFCIAKIKLEEIVEGELHPKTLDRYNTMSIKGEMARLEYGDVVEFTITLDEVHPIYGASYNVKFSRQDFQFKNEDDVRLFLSKILTPLQVDELYLALDKPLEAIESKDIKALTKVKGIGEVVAQRIIDKYETTKDFASAYVELDGYGLSTDAINSLIEQYGSPDILIEKIQENPYVLVELDGYGFKRADKIALTKGLDKNSVKRVSAFIDFALNDLGKIGYSWIDSGHLMALIEENLGEDIEMDIILEAVNYLKLMKKVWNEEKGKIGCQKFYELELKIVKELIRLLNGNTQKLTLGWEDRVKQAEILQGWGYTDEQKEAIEFLANQNVGILLGLAGSGKTSTVLGILKALDEDEINFSMCCLAGKASARLSEATGYPASTIHRLLGYNPKKGFEHNRKNPLISDVVILDEYSLVGGELFYQLVQAIPTGCKFYMLGDFGQLSAVGSLNIAKDTTESNIIPKRELTKIHRQAEKSAIITQSRNIRFGEQLFKKGWTGNEVYGELQDLEVQVVDNKELIPKMVLNEFIKTLEKESDIMEVQVISPLNTKGGTSAFALNKLLQNHYNPTTFDDGKPEIRINITKDLGYNIKENDKVIALKNDYEAITESGKQVELFNGYLGIVKKIEGSTMYIHFPLIGDECLIVQPNYWQEKKGISLAYAISTHKMQGSGANYIINVLDYSHYVMLCKQQLYTAITRAKLHTTVIGESRAITYAISTDEVADKQTFMKDLLIKIAKENENGECERVIENY